ncbi:MAG: hypothetical protein R3B60_05105 [Candidatus Paceibacterota bacterium]
MDDQTIWLQKYFNNREIATGFWLLVLAILLLYWNKTRDSIKELLHVILQKKLLILFASLAIYLVGLCWLLSELSLWTSVQVPATSLWFFLSGVVLLGRSLSLKEDDRYFRKLVFDSFKVAAIFEIIVVAYTFNFLAELLLVPLFAILGALIAISGTNEKYRPAKNLFETIVSLIVVILLWLSISQIWQTPDDFFTTQNGRNFLLPILLTIGSIPLFYLWYCYSSYETAAISFEFKKIHTDKAKQYAKRKFFLSFFFKPWLLKRALRQFNLLPTANNENAKNIINFIKLQEKRAKNPPAVNANKGWSPYLARDFLKVHGLRTSDYHTTYNVNDEWYACSSHVDLDNQALRSKVSFYLSGQEELVNKLKLVGDFNTISNTPNEALLKFREVALDLTKSALGISTEEAAALISDKSQFEIVVGKTKISGWIEKYPTHMGFYKYLLFSRDLSKN